MSPQSRQASPARDWDASTALADVQQMSDSAFTAAEAFT